MKQVQNTQLLLKKVEHLVQNAHTSALRDLARELHPSQVADLIEAMPANRTELWHMLNPVQQGQALLQIESVELRHDLILQTDTDKLRAALTELTLDEQADFLEDMPHQRSQPLLAALEKQDQESVKQALTYDKDTAGGIMHIDTITVRDNLRLSEVVKFLHSIDDLPPRLDRLFVVDECNRYKGVLRVLALFRNSDDTLVEDAMDYSETVRYNLPVSEVVRLFDDWEVLRAPVVDDDGTLLGHIVADDVIDAMRREARATENSAALLPQDESLFSPIASSTKRRGIWLGLNLVTAFLASLVISLFDTTLEKVIALAILLPIVASMGGIAGGQTLTLVVRSIATGQFGQSNFTQLLKKETILGLISGILWGANIGIIAGLWFSSVGIGLIIAGAIIVNLSCAAAAGVVIPYFMKRIGVDPALSGGVLLTTITDIVGIVVFLGLGMLFLL